MKFLSFINLQILFQCLLTSGENFFSTSYVSSFLYFVNMLLRLLLKFGNYTSIYVRLEKYSFFPDHTPPEITTKIFNNLYLHNFSKV